MTTTEPMLRRLNLRAVDVHPQVRKHFDKAKLAELADSIRVHGVLQPITVIPDPNPPDHLIERFYVLAGERRLRAAREAGLVEIDAIVRADLVGQDITALQLVENLQREGLTLPEEVAGVVALVEKVGVNEAARKLGRDKAWVSRMAKFPQLWEQARNLVEEGHVTGIELAVDLSTLHDEFPEAADQLVAEFREPPEWRGGAPTRELVRYRLKSERDAKVRADNAERSAAQLPSRNDKATTAPERKPASPSGEPAVAEESPREVAMRERRLKVDALIKPAEEAAWQAEYRLGRSLGLEQSKEDDPIYSWIDPKAEADDNGRTLQVVAPDLSIWDTDEAIASYDPDKRLWKIEVELTKAQLEDLVARMEGKAGTAAVPERWRAVKTFLEATIQPAPGDRVKSSWLYERYTKACKKAKAKPISANEFSQAVEGLGIKKRKAEDAKYFLDVRPAKGVR